MQRCDWCGADLFYPDHHDTEWSVPEYDARALWEKLVLESFQAGLSWITILKKRDNSRSAFAGFDPHIVAQWGEPEIRTLLGNSGIIRHRPKYRPRSKAFAHGKRSKIVKVLANFYGNMWMAPRCNHIANARMTSPHKRLCLRNCRAT